MKIDSTPVFSDFDLHVDWKNNLCCFLNTSLLCTPILAIYLNITVLAGKILMFYCL
jgi:hypothetical protein